MGSEVLLEYDGPIAWVTLNRPEKYNAENLGWVRELHRIVKEVAQAEQVRLVVIQGKGSSFCAGMDLDMLAEEGMPPEFYPLQEEAFRGLELMDKLVIAAIQGYCLGGGVQLAVACDIRICSADCRLGLPAIQEGLFPGLSPWRLPKLIGLGAARHLILTGAEIGAEEALRLGLADHLLPTPPYEDELKRLLDFYLRLPFSATVASKRLLRISQESSFEQAYEQSRQLLEECLASAEVAVARANWLKRKQGKSGQRDAG